MPLHQTYNTLLSASRLLFYFIHKQVKPVPPPHYQEHNYLPR